jgi:hypothetical protein
MVQGLTEEELKKLSPEARLRRLRELEEQRKKELEETRKQVEDEIAAAEQLIRKTEDELDEEQVLNQLKETSKRTTEEIEESLEDLVAKERIETKPSEQYKTETPDFYRTAERDTYEVSRLAEKPIWDDRDRELYEQAKEDYTRMKTYDTMTDRMEEQFGLLSNAFNTLKYRH